MFTFDGKEYDAKKLALMLGVALGFFVMVYVVTPSCNTEPCSHSHSQTVSSSASVTSSSSSSSSSDGVGGHGAGSVCVGDGSNGGGGAGGNCESSVVNESL